MILQALNEYYERKSSDPNDALAPMGFEWKPIPFVIELSSDGRFVQLEDTREKNGAKKIAKSFLVPKSKIRSGVKAYESPNILWDHYGFVLGYAKHAGKDKEPSEKDVVTANLQREHFIKLVNEMYDNTEDAGLQAVLKFLRAGDFSKLFTSSQWEECSGINGCNLAFRVQGSRELVCQSRRVIEYVTNLVGAENGEVSVESICLVSGEVDSIERLHPSVSGVGEKPGPLSAVNDGSLPAFASFGKHQGLNFPVSKKVAFAYTTALNHLLKRDGGQRMQVGDASTVFWAEKPTDLETGVVNIFGEPKKDNPDSNVRAIEQLFRSVHNGRYVADDKNTRFYVLGLAPNAARIAVRFWHVASVGELAERIIQHFSDLEIVHGPNEPPFLSLFRLLVSTAAQSDSKNIPPNLAGDVMRSILEGLSYPQTLLGAAVRRIKAEQHVSYPRAALIKACINRATRYSNPENKEVLKVSLDEQNTNIGYRLGRLFAVLEKVQEEANPGINATIRDRYYGSASSSPVTVFSTLLKLKNHHIPKLSKGRSVNMERLIGEIMREVDDFPPTLELADQGRFAIGYYHQRQDFYTTKETKEISDE